MKKVQNLGKSLSKIEQKQVSGGTEETNVVRRGICGGGSSGEWIYTPAVDYPTCSADILVYCGSGQGSCVTWF